MSRRKNRWPIPMKPGIRKDSRLACLPDCPSGIARPGTPSAYAVLSPGQTCTVNRFHANKQRLHDYNYTVNLRENPVKSEKKSEKAVCIP